MPESQTKILNSKDEDFKKKLNNILKVNQKNQLNLYNTVFVPYASAAIAWAPPIQINSVTSAT